MTRKPHTKLLRVVLSEVSGRGFGLYEWSIAVSEVGVQEAGKGFLTLTC
jgi:hypothetical protein